MAQSYLTLSVVHYWFGSLTKLNTVVGHWNFLTMREINNVHCNLLSNDWKVNHIQHLYMRHYSGRKEETDQIQHKSRISLFQWGDVLITISSLDSEKKCLNDKTLLQPLGQSLVIQKVKSITSIYNEYNSLLTTKLVSTCQDLPGLKFLDRFMSCQMFILADQVNQMKTRLAILGDQIYQLRVANHLQAFGFKETHKPSFISVTSLTQF